MIKYLVTVSLVLATSMHAAVTEIQTNEQFESEVTAVTDRLVVVDFYAPWCGPCKTMGPIFAELAVRYSDVKFVKVNVDDAPQLKARFGIQGIPRFILFRRGNQVASMYGANRSELKEKIESYR